MMTAKLFLNGHSQAVRLPKEFRFDGEEVCIAKLDDMVLLYPREQGWDLLTKSIDRFTDEFLADRGQPEESEGREAI